MALNSTGDMAQSYAMRQRHVALKQDITRLTTELSTGQVSDPRKLMGGNTSYLVDMDRQLELLGGYAVATTEASYFADTMQTALGQLSYIAQAMSADLMVAASNPTGASRAETPARARDALTAIIATLNTDAAGRQLFSGTATDRSPLVDADTLLSGLKLAMSGLTDPAQMASVAKGWFDDPAGFEALAYRGSPVSLAPLSLSSRDSISLDVKATDAVIKDLLRTTALAALAIDPAFSLDTSAQSDLFAAAGKSTLASRDGLIGLQARVGTAQARIDTISARNAAEKTSLEYAKSALLTVDPYESATRLEEVQFQLQSLYTVTVRMSQLSLVNFL